MTEQLPDLGRHFDASSVGELDDHFTELVLERTDRSRRMRIAGRVGLTLTLALIGVPLQDFGLVVVEGLLVALVPVGDGLIAQLLAPVNTVGGLLSAVLLGLRVMYKRLFN